MHGGMPSCGCRPPKHVDVDECKDVKFHKCLFTHITTSVGITIPNHFPVEVNYKICFGNATCQKGVISVFGNPGATVQKNLPINSEHFVILEDRVRMILYRKFLFYNKSDLRKKIWGQKMELSNDPALREQVPLKS